MQATTIGLDIAKSVFQVHGVDARGRTVLRKRLTRAKVLALFANLPRCMIGLEACGGAHYWARELIRLGHDARLMPPQYVKARRSAPTSVVGAGSQARVKNQQARRRRRRGVLRSYPAAEHALRAREERGSAGAS
jgi:transposase